MVGCPRDFCYGIIHVSVRGVTHRAHQGRCLWVSVLCSLVAEWVTRRVSHSSNWLVGLSLSLFTAHTITYKRSPAHSWYTLLATGPVDGCGYCYGSFAAHCASDPLQLCVCMHLQSPGHPHCGRRPLTLGYTDFHHCFVSLLLRRSVFYTGEVPFAWKALVQHQRNKRRRHKYLERSLMMLHTPLLQASRWSLCGPGGSWPSPLCPSCARRCCSSSTSGRISTTFPRRTSASACSRTSASIAQNRSGWAGKDSQHLTLWVGGGWLKLPHQLSNLASVFFVLKHCVAVSLFERNA